VRLAVRARQTQRLAAHAAGSLGLTGLLAWPLSRPDVSADAALVRALYFLVFLVGGPGHIVALGLLVAGIACRALRWA
jgi:hypothetical protein